MVLSVGAAMEVGQQVRVFRLRDRAPQVVVNRLGQTGIIEGYKMVDGSGVGLIVRFEDKFATWFFEDEIKPV